jgi:hypothetical protein
LEAILRLLSCVAFGVERVRVEGIESGDVRSIFVDVNNGRRSEKLLQR